MKFATTIPLFLLFAAQALFGQTKGQRMDYFPDLIRIKFEENAPSSVARKKFGIAPQVAAQQALQALGVELKTSEWKPEFDAKFRQKAGLSSSSDRKREQLVSGLKRTFSARVTGGDDPMVLASKLSRVPGIEWAEPIYIYQTQATPNDPFIGGSGHNYFILQRFLQAWDVTTGSSDVIIAIVDSGVDYTHPDLDDKLWRNADEIANNGIDDDDNGFVDDVIGWDFWQSGTTNADLRSDNDPLGEFSNHGTHVAGTAAAETNNGVGIAGTGYNSTYMAVKAGGTEDNPRSVGFGYQGILYATLNGADVINNSWGGPGVSQFGRDVVAFAIENGSVVLAAASNDNEDAPSFPAALPGVISVGSVGTNLNGNSTEKSSFSNFHFSVDVMATGFNLRSTVFNEQYGFLSGTSMATPVVSGLAALVKAVHPDWSAQRIAAQIRSSARNIDLDNPSFTNKLGNGLIDAAAAVGAALPGLEVLEAEFVNSEGRKLGLNETGSLEVTLVNYGAPASGVQINIETLTPGFRVINNSASIASLATDAQTTLSIPIEVTGFFNLTSTPAVRLGFSASGDYSDFRVAEFSDFGFEVLDGNNIMTSFASNGTMGFSDLNDEQSGVGFSVNLGSDQEPQFSDNVLFSSGLMIQVNNRVNDAVINAQGNQGFAFKQKSLFRSSSDDTGQLFGTGLADNSGTLLSPRYELKTNTFTLSGEELSNVIFVEYQITNKSTTVLRDVFVGIYNDWDVGNFSANSVGFLATDSLMYVFEEGNEATPYVASLPVLGISSLFAIKNGFAGTPDSLNFGIFPSDDPADPFDGFTDQEKKWSLTNKFAKTTQLNTDVSLVVAAGPYTIAAEATVSVGFIHAYGRTLQELTTQVANARANLPFDPTQPDRFLTPVQEIERPTLPTQTRLIQNFPNPFNPTTQISFELAQAGQVQLDVYNVLGQKVATLVNDRLSAGQYQSTLDARNLASGIYIAVLRTQTASKTIRMTLVK